MFKIAKEFISYLLKRLTSKKVKLRLKKPIVSITFDDVPRSAVENGLAILNQFDYTATFYVASGIGDSLDKEKFFLNSDHLHKLYQGGHEIACHTFSHNSLRFESKKVVELECKKNFEHISYVLPDVKITNFSYPLGQISWFAQGALLKKFRSLRTTEQGINENEINFAHLKSINLYSKEFSRKKIARIIDQAIKKNAWVIFYTHDISDNYTDWGTSINDFKWFIQYCNKKNLDILTINEAIDKIEL